MKSHLLNHPLNGINLETLLTELVDHYGWDVLASQIPINCFTSYPSIKSSLKFLRRTAWARERLEAFYLYQYCQYPRPSDDEHGLIPRERDIDTSRAAEPAALTVDDPEFFDDPASGPVFPSKREVSATQTASKKSSIDKPYKQSVEPLDEAPELSNSAGLPVGSEAAGSEAEVFAETKMSAESVVPAKTTKVPSKTKDKELAKSKAPTPKDPAKGTDQDSQPSANPWSKALAKLGETPDSDT